MTTSEIFAPVEASAPASGLWRKLFSLPALLVVLLCLVAFWSSSFRFRDPDMWWHLKVGQQIAQTGELPRTDEFSYTTDSHAWIPHEWLAEVTIYEAYRFGGNSGLMLWLCLWGSVLLGGLYLLCASYSGNPKVALIGGLIGWFFATISLAVRPLLIGHACLVGLLALVQLGKTRDARWFWGLPPLFAFWVNCHGSFALGMAVLATVLATAHVDLNWGLLESTRWPAEKLRTLRLAFLASCAALFVNPIGPQLVVYPFNLFFAQSDNLANITEWRPLNFQEPRGMAVFAIVTVLTLAALTLQKKVRVEEFIVVVLGAYLAVKHTRLIFIFGILAAPVVCRLLATTWRNYRLSQDSPRINAALMAIALALIWWRFPSAANLQEQVDAGYPTKAIEYLQQNGVSGNLLNEYSWGGYLIWKAPERKVFIDGRTDIFDWTGVLKDFMRWYTLQEPPNELLDKYKVDYCLLFKSAQMSRVLEIMPEWEVAYSDDLAIVFRRKKEPPAPPGGVSRLP